MSKDTPLILVRTSIFSDEQELRAGFAELDEQIGKILRELSQRSSPAMKRLAWPLRAWTY